VIIQKTKEKIHSTKLKATNGVAVTIIVKSEMIIVCKCAAAANFRANQRQKGSKTFQSVWLSTEDLKPLLTNNMHGKGMGWGNSSDRWLQRKIWSDGKPPGWQKSYSLKNMIMNRRMCRYSKHTEKKNWNKKTDQEKIAFIIQKRKKKRSLASKH